MLIVSYDLIISLVMTYLKKNKRFFFWLIITLLLAILPWFIL